MDVSAVRATEGRPKRAGGSRIATLAIMAVTAAVIVAVAVMTNQPAKSATGLTNVTTTGVATGEPPTVGKAAPDFTATTVDGKAVKLSDFRGQPVWLSFGASWCQPCRAENPDIQAAFTKYQARGLVVLQVYMTEDSAAVKDYATRVGLTYQKIPDPDTRISSQYRILGIPTHFFIDRTGVLRQLRIGSLDPPAMDTMLAGILP